jgi:hypothetical protein
MAVPNRRIVPALLVLLVLFASQLAYAAQAASRPSGHCAGHAPAEKTDPSCPLPLWLTCCDQQAAVGTALVQPPAASPLALRLDAAWDAPLAPGHMPAEVRAEIPPDTPLRLCVVLLI